LMICLLPLDPIWILLPLFYKYPAKLLDRISKKL
jgi:hypothetical protein